MINIFTGFIYIITNKINDKVYIGQTRQENPEKRWEQHINDFKRATKNTKLVQSVKRIGIDNFSFEVIDERQYEEVFQLDLVEWEYIKQYDSCNNGYNSDEGNNINKSAEMKILGNSINKLITVLKRNGENRTISLHKKEDLELIQALTILSYSEELKKSLNMFLHIDNLIDRVNIIWENYENWNIKLDNAMQHFWL